MSGQTVQAQISAAVARMRQTNPLVQCLTNIVVANFTANVLLAAGASPAMVDCPEEAGMFAGIAHGTLVNVGTPYAETAEAMVRAAETATNLVVDPVAYGMPWRSQIIRDVLAKDNTAIIRGNASEIMALAGAESAGRGTDAGDATIDALPVAQDLARRHHCTVAVSGPVDYITDGATTLSVSSGHEWMTKVTGVGCSLGALMAAYAGVCDDLVIAATAATAHYCVAAERAAARTTGTGSFAVALLDELMAVTPDDVAGGQIREA